MARICVVDDDLLVVVGMQKILQSRQGGGHTVITCLDPLDALDKLEQDDTIKVLITDWMMPGFSGLDVLTVVQQRFPNVIRILLTAAPREPDVRKAIKEGLVQHLFEKPWDLSLMRATLASL